MPETTLYLGQGLSLLTAVIWAFAVVLFKKSGETVHPLALNLFKNSLAMLLFIPTMLLFKIPFLLRVPNSEYLLLILSGAIGIGIGDTYFFKSLNQIGAGLSAIVVCMYSPFIITLSLIFLGESLSLLQVFGALLIISAVLSTIRIRRIEDMSQAALLRGILWGIFATAAMAVGVILFKPVLGRAPLLWVTEVRLFGGLISLVFITSIFPSARKQLSTLFCKKGLGYTISSSFLGAYLAMIIWIAGMKFTQASIASALNQTSTIFVFIFAALILRESITPRRIIAVVLAVSGVFLVFLG